MRRIFIYMNIFKKMFKKSSKEKLLPSLSVSESDALRYCVVNYLEDLEEDGEISQNSPLVAILKRVDVKFHWGITLLSHIHE